MMFGGMVRFIYTFAKETESRFASIETQIQLAQVEWKPRIIGIEDRFRALTREVLSRPCFESKNEVMLQRRIEILERQMRETQERAQSRQSDN